MAKCRLLISIPGETMTEDAWAAPGESLDVVVHVEVDAEVKCTALTLERCWRAHGRGNRDEGASETLELFSGTWSPGHYEYPATIPMGQGVATYHGKHISLDWFLVACADIPWAFDPKDERIVLSIPPAAAPYAPPPASVLEPVEMSGNFTGCMMPAILGMGISAGLVGFGHPMYAAILAAVSAIVWACSARDRAKTKRLGEVSFGVWPEQIYPSSEVHAFLEIAPASALKLDSVRTTLVATEYATSGSGSDETTYTHEALHLTEDVTSNESIRSSLPYFGEAAFVIPEDAPATLNASSNRIEWVLQLEITLAGGAVQTHNRTLTVLGSPNARGERGEDDA